MGRQDGQLHRGAVVGEVVVVGLARESGAAVVQVQPVGGPHAQVLEVHLDVGLARGQRQPGVVVLHPVGPVPELERRRRC